MTEQKRRGRPKLSTEEKTVAITVTVTESQAEYLQKLGEGNVSAGVREMIDIVEELKDAVGELLRNPSDDPLYAVPTKDGYMLTPKQIAERRARKAYQRGHYANIG